MKRSVGIWLAIGIALVFLGLVLCTLGLRGVGFDLSKLSTEEFITNTYEVSDDFESISVKVHTTDVSFQPSDAQTCRIVCLETEKMKHSASVQNGTLVIEVIDSRSWYDNIGVSFESPKMTVYLPKDAYVSLFIDTNTGDVKIPASFSFEKIELWGDTADITCFASVTEQMNISTDTGDLLVKSAASAASLAFETDTGDIELNLVSCKNIAVETDTGDIALKGVAAESFFIQSETGDILFDRSDAAEIRVKTNSGDVRGTLLSEKNFITETRTGRISVPKSAAGGTCEITTNTGDIAIDLK